MVLVVMKKRAIRKRKQKKDGSGGMLRAEGMRKGRKLT